MTEEVRAHIEKYSAMIKEANKRMGYFGWRLVECGPEEVADLLMQFREAGAICTQLKDEDVAFHAARKGAETIALKLTPEQLEDERIRRMIANGGEVGLQKQLLQNRKMAILSKLDHLSVEELETILSVKDVQAELARAQIKLAEYERLALEGKKDRLVRLALSNADLTKIKESKPSRIVNNQLRSGGPIRRIESGDGR